MNSRIVFFLLFLIPMNITAQSDKIDSLRLEIKKTSNSDELARLNIAIARQHKEVSLDSAILYFQKALSHIDTLNPSAIRTDHYYYLSEVYFEYGRHESVLTTLDKVFLPNQEDDEEITREDIDVRKAQVYLRTGRYEQASDLLLAALPKLENTDKLSTLASCYNGLGTVMQYGRRLDQALMYYQKAYETNLEEGALHNAYGGLANIATIHSRNGDFDLSMPAYRKVIAFCQGKKETHLEALATGNLGMNHRDLNALDSAEFYIKRALELHKLVNNKRGVASSSSMLSGVLLKRKKYRETIELAEPQYQIAADQKNLRLQDRLAEKLGIAYKEVGNLSKSIYYIEKHAELRDTLYKKEVADAVNDAQTKYETEKKEAEIERLALEDQFNQERIRRQKLALGGSIIGLGLLSFLLYRILGQKRKIESQSEVIEKSLHEKETLLREIHHRVKNNLQIISSLLGLQSRSLDDKAAIDALTQSRARVQSMSLIHQNLYQRDNLTGIQVKEYFEKLSGSLINTYRISEDIEISADIQDLLLDVDTIIPLGLIINELLTNALKYAFPNQKGNIKVQLHEQEQRLHLSVRDDGIGIENPDEVLQGEGYGYELITSLVEKLEGDIHILNQDGTVVNMSFSNYEKLEK